MCEDKKRNKLAAAGTVVVEKKFLRGGGLVFISVTRVFISKSKLVFSVVTLKTLLLILLIVERTWVSSNYFLLTYQEQLLNYHYTD